MELRISIPDEVAPRVLDALAARYGYVPEQGPPNLPPQAQKVVFARQVVANFLRQIVRDHEQAQATSQAGMAVDKALGGIS